MLRKFIGEVTLLGQPFVKDPDTTIAKLIGTLPLLDGDAKLHLNAGLGKARDERREWIGSMAFEHKLQTYRESGAIDWYSPETSKEMDRIYPTAASKEEIELDNTVADYAQAIVNNKAAIRAAEAGIDEAEKKIKEALGQAERGRAGQYVISWPMRNYKAQPERLVAAKEAYSIRQSTLTIKDLQS